MLPRVTVRKMLIDGKQWGIWEPYVLPIEAEFVALWTPVGMEMRWATGTFQGTFNTIHYWWTGTQYFIGAHYDGVAFAGCYCDVVLPLPALALDAPRREYTDLYLDLVVRGDRSWFTKDQEIYDRAEQAIPALQPLRPAAEAALSQLEEWAGTWSGPFARIPATLPRTDWHLLEPDSPACVEGLRALFA